jgi:hypothetical protein
MALDNKTTIHGTKPISPLEYTEDEKLHVLAGTLAVEVGRLQPTRATLLSVLEMVRKGSETEERHELSLAAAKVAARFAGMFGGDT